MKFLPNNMQEMGNWMELNRRYTKRDKKSRPNSSKNWNKNGYEMQWNNIVYAKHKIPFWHRNNICDFSLKHTKKN